MYLRKQFIYRIIAMLCCGLTPLAVLGDTPVAHQYKLIEPGKVMLRPYIAHYNVRFHGISGGDIEATLTKTGNNHYVFRSHLLPNFLGRFFTSDQAEDTSEFEITADGLIHPLHFKSEDGTSNTKNNITLDFDWNTDTAMGTVKGHADDKDFSMPVPVGTQDRLTIQLTASLALQARRDIGVLDMQERNELQKYKITRQGTETIHTDAGDFNTEVLLSERVSGSSRSSRYWYAPELGYIPAHAERSSHGKVDIVMNLEWVKLGE